MEFMETMTTTTNLEVKVKNAVTSKDLVILEIDGEVYVLTRSDAMDLSRMLARAATRG
jgi:hypothetical protein